MHQGALELNAALGRKEGVAAAYANLGRVHQTRGDLPPPEGKPRQSVLKSECG